MFYKFVEFVNKIKTMYRRINHPEIKRNYLVIDIGSGNLPNPRADVTCDFIDEDLERSDDLKIDRPFVWANIEKLPFRDRIFDYSITSHVLEHVDNPKEALEEIQRISKGGYIETPNAFYEFAIPHVYHLSRCTVIDGKLIITMKDKWDETIDKKYPDILHDMNKAWWDLHKLNAISLLTIYRWKNKINYEIRGGKAFTKEKELMEEVKTDRSWIRILIIKLVYFLKRRKKIDITKILICPRCKGFLNFSDDFSVCDNCFSKYKKHKGFFDFRII